MASVRMLYTFLLVNTAESYCPADGRPRSTSIVRRHKSAQEITAMLNLQEHFEGGHFRQTWRANITVDLLDYTRVPSTSIYYVMARGQTLAWHKLRSDNIHVWHSGGYLKIHILEPKVNGVYRIEYLGNTLHNRHRKFQIIVPGDHWYAVEVRGRSNYTLWGEIVSPGWEIEDFEYGTKEDLLRLYPNLENLVEKLVLKSQ